MPLFTLDIVVGRVGLLFVPATQLIYTQNNHKEIVLIKHCLAH